MSNLLEEASAEEPVRLKVGPDALEGRLTVPDDAGGIILFARGHLYGAQDRAVAEALNKAGLATLLLGLLTPREEQEDERTGFFRSNVDLLTDRLVIATDWLRHNPETLHLTAPWSVGPREPSARGSARRLRIGYLGAGTGAAAALMAAPKRPEDVHAVVSRDGRPDLVLPALSDVRAPTLLIVGGSDPALIELNRDAFDRIEADKALEIVPGAGRLFDEPRFVQEVARLATSWFKRHLLGERPVRR